MLFISSFIDDVIFARKPRLLDVAPNGLESYSNRARIAIVIGP